MTPKQISQATQIHSRALLVWLTISTWSARKYDRQVSNKVNNDYNASSDAGRYNKFLLPGDAKAYKTLTALATSIRSEHYTQTLPWSNEGERILPTASYMAYTTWLRDRQKEFATALSDFLDDYPMMRSRAPQLLGKLYRDDDYPAIGDLRKRFSLSVEYRPLPAIGDVRVDLAADQVADIQAAIVASQTNAITIAIRDCWQRLYDVVARIHERLNQPDAIFRDSLIVNARELCDLLPRLNVTEDPELEAMRARVEKQLTNIDPDVLRDNARLRSTVASQADDILKKMSGLFEVA